MTLPNPFEKLIRKSFLSSKESLWFSICNEADWSQFIKEVILEYIENNSEKIGGTGRIVEVGESKFGKRKCHRGHPVEGFRKCGTRIRKGFLNCSSRQISRDSGKHNSGMGRARNYNLLRMLEGL
ncbi:hypothetical protein NPIL_5841 [Nephila pilipes]|uniref:Uncharacterized protein n=1 Tax=Nephila pilipes TaxID=299642 RepID=A0A8X6QB56_NEPPI|nr:hypothetical protein NPIL_5841 [Nephila pilipes]